MRYSAHNIKVAIEHGCGRYDAPYVRLRFGSEDPVFLDMDDALRLHKRLGQMLNKHTTPQRRAKAVRS